MKLLNTLIFSIATLSLSAQTYLDSTLNSSTKKVLFANPNSFAIGSYGEAHYNQPINNNEIQQGKMDLHRIIMFMGYKFNSKLQFFTEIEFEHTDELAVEQAYLNYGFDSRLNFKTGVILIPMGYVNEFHEPTLFNGVERSLVDSRIIPSTWREMGAGFHGIFKKANIKYQAYVVNGFNGYNGNATITESGLRSSRQNGGNASFRTPSLTGKITYYGLNGLRLGISGYQGQTESTLYNGIERNDTEAIATADSSTLTLAMAAVNAQYTLKNFRFMFIGNITNIGNTEQYNSFTGENVASKIVGYYGEVAYHQQLKNGHDFPKLIPFVRYENFDTQHEVRGNAARNAVRHQEVLTTGLGLQITPGTIFKADFQWLKNEINPRPTNMLNLGFGYWF